MPLTPREPEPFSLGERALFTVVPVSPTGELLFAGIRPDADRPAELWLLDATQGTIGLDAVLRKAPATW
jgi:hypothetical protein